MDKLQSEYEALQQKLAILKRKPQRTATAAPASEPRPLQQAQFVQSTPLGTGAAVAAAASAIRSAAKPAAPNEVAGTPALLGSAYGLAENRVPSQSGAFFGAAATAGRVGSGAACSTSESSALQSQCGAVDPGVLLQFIRFRERHAGSALCTAAATVFEDAEFVRLCEQCMSAQLQRTKEGATSQSRMLELAGAHGASAWDWLTAGLGALRWQVVHAGMHVCTCVCAYCMRHMCAQQVGLMNCTQHWPCARVGS